MGGLGDAAYGVGPVCRQHVLHHAVRARRAAQTVGRARAAQLPAGHLAHRNECPRQRPSRRTFLPQLPYLGRLCHSRAHRLGQRPAPLFQLRPTDRPQPLGAPFAPLHLGQLSPALRGRRPLLLAQSRHLHGRVVFCLPQHGGHRLVPHDRVEHRPGAALFLAFSAQRRPHRPRCVVFSRAVQLVERASALAPGLAQGSARRRLHRRQRGIAPVPRRGLWIYRELFARPVRALRHQHEPADRLCLSVVGPRDLRRLGPHHLAGRTGLLSRSGGSGRVYRQHPRVVVGGCPGPDGAGAQLPLVGRHPHLRHGLGRHGPQAGGSDAPRIPSLVLGHCRGHCRHYGWLHHRSHLPRVHLRRHQPEQLAVRLYDDLYRQLDYQQPQQPAAHPRLAPILCRPRRVLDGPVDVYKKPLRRLSHSPHRLGHRAAASRAANLAVGLYGLAA